jgi:hypothetical protein
MKMKAVFLGLAALAMVGACCGTKGEVPIKGERREEVLRLAEPMVDSLMESYNSGDYERYVKDFTDRLREDATEEKFEETRTFILERVGRYLARKSPDVVARGPNLILTYKADFEKENGVVLRLVFHAANKQLRVANIRYVSPRLQPPG